MLGSEVAAKFGLVPQKTGYFGGYDQVRCAAAQVRVFSQLTRTQRCDASVSHEFATSAFRFGHTLIRDEFPRLNGSYGAHSEPLQCATFLMRGVHCIARSTACAQIARPLP